MERTNDTITLCGRVTGAPELSHTGKEGEYYRFPLTVKRLSGTEDTLNIIVRGEFTEYLRRSESCRLRVTGEVRSYNNRSGIGPRLVITVFARSLEFTDDDYENSVSLTGTICKAPNLRSTPMGREICDIMLAVNRRYGKSDYLPCIAWGALARESSSWPVGTRIRLTGRMQSRVYIKSENGISTENVAFEISAVTMAPVCGEENADSF